MLSYFSLLFDKKVIHSYAFLSGYNMKKTRIACIVLLLLSIYLPLRSQLTPQYRKTHEKIAPDSLDITYYSMKKKWLQASATAFGINMGVWTFDRYIQKGHFAYISIHTMKENFRKGLIWDNDYMGTNMFLHPYHGNLYFNAGRANGLNYWESGAIALGGSAMWEFFMECEYPSTNDIIATPIGGMILGETLFRTSDLILDDRKTGKQRFGRELAAFIVSPSRGITRIVNGDAWKKRKATGRVFGNPDINVDIAAGLRVLELESPIIDKGFGLAINLNVEYGDRFEEEPQKPFDYFSFSANINGQGSQPILSQLNIVGRLYSMELINDSKNFLSIGIYQHFDYYDSDTISAQSAKVPYKFSTPASVGIGLMHQDRRLRKWNINSYLHFNGIILGASLSDHYVVSNRNYNLASGFSWQSGINLSYRDIFKVSGAYEAYRMFTWKGYDREIDWETVNIKTLDAQGDHSQAILHAISLRCDLKLRNRLYLTAIGYNYTRDTNYKYFEDVFSKTFEGRLMLTYQLW